MYVSYSKGMLASADLSARQSVLRRCGQVPSEGAVHSFFYTGSIAVLALGILGIVGVLLRR
jgi:hypothetical protein